MSYSLEAISQGLEYPIGYPPPGVVPDFENPPSNAWRVYLCAGFCLSIVLVATSLHIYRRTGLGNKSLTWSDVLLLSSATGVIWWIAVDVAVFPGESYGRHGWNVLLGSITKRQLVLSTLLATFYPLWILTIKISMLCLYLEIFGTKRWVRHWSYGSMVVMTMSHLALLLVWPIARRPRGGQSQVSWLAGYSDPSYLNDGVYLICQSVINLLGDLFLVILPLPAVWSLQLSTRKKIEVSAMFLTGLCAIVASVMRLYYWLQLDKTGDFTWISADYWNSTMCEMTAGILVICMPSIGFLIRKGFHVVKPKVISFHKTSFSSLTSSEMTGSSSSRPRLSLNLSFGGLSRIFASQTSTAVDKSNTTITAPYSPLHNSFGPRHPSWTRADQASSQSRIWSSRPNSESFTEGAEIKKTTEYSIQTYT